MRLGAFIAAFYYFVITVGISLSLHFCNGELSCFSLVPGNDSFCCHSDELSEDTNSTEHAVCVDNCCSTEFMTIALDTDFTSKSMEFNESVIFLPNDHNQTSSEEINTVSSVKANTTRGSPLSEDLYLIHSQLIFYG